MKIREFTPEDASALAEIFHRAVRDVGARYYTQAQVEAWSPAPLPDEAFTARMSDGRLVLVAVTEDDTPLAFIELETDGHIDRFYCHPEFVGVGVGSALYEKLADAALELGLSRLFVEASEAARVFFEGKQFTLVRRQDFERRGVQMHNYQMEKRLS